MSESLIRLALLNVALAVSGAGFLSAVGWCRPRETLRQAGLSYVVGVAWIGVSGSLSLIVGSALRLPLIALLLAVPAVAAALRVAWQESWPAPQVVQGRWAIVPATSIAAIVALRGTSYSMRGWDAWSFWVPKAVSIVDFHGLSAAFLRSGIANPDYPPLLPTFDSVFFRAQGSLDTTLLHMQFGILLAGFAAAAAEILLRTRASPMHIALVLSALVAAPAVYTQTLDVYADVPLAIFVAVGALLLWNGDASRRWPARLITTLLFAAAFQTKAEGMIFVVAVLASVAVTRAVSVRVVAFVLSVAAVLSLVPWRLWLRVHHISSAYHFDASRITGDPQRATAATRALGAALAAPGKWLLLPAVIVLALVFSLAKGERRYALFVLGSVACSLLGLVLVYWGTPYPFAWHVHTSVDRVIVTPMFIAATASATLLAQPAVKGASKRLGMRRTTG